MASQHQRLILRAAALERDAVDRADIVQHQLVIDLRRTIGYLDRLDMLLQQTLDLLFYLRVRYVHALERALESLVIQHFHLS